jgi:hypothetical protein
MSNLKQLQLAWQMYCGDNKDKVVLTDSNWNTPGAATEWAQYWCGGTMSDYFNCTNLFTLTDGLLYPYVGTVNVYKCPADVSTQQDARNAASSGRGSAPRVRSMSCSQVFAPAAASTWLPSSLYRVYAKSAQIVKPADTWVYIDQATKSIDDGAFANVIAPPTSTSADEPDYPAGFHNGAGGLSFSDGHAIIHKWQSPLTYTPWNVVLPDGPSEQFSSNPQFVRDMIWFSSETTVHN